MSSAIARGDTTPVKESTKPRAGRWGYAKAKNAVEVYTAVFVRRSRKGDDDVTMERWRAASRLSLGIAGHLMF
jgi:hypothetical protein